MLIQCQIVEAEHPTHGDDGSTVFFLELAETAGINDTRNDVPHIKCLPEVRTHNAMKFMGWIEGIF